jgi:hypothetical protein
VSAHVAVVYVAIVLAIVLITVRPIVRGTPVRAVIATVAGVVAVGLVTVFVVMVTKS